MNKNVQVLTLREQESVLAKQMVVWDAAAKQMKSFTAISNGSYSQGTVMVKGDQVIFKNEGANASGKKQSGTIVYTKKDDDSFVIEAKDGVVGGEPHQRQTESPTNPARLAECSLQLAHKSH